MDPYKELVRDFLTNDFVDNYEYHKECLDKLNLELQELGVPYTYTYDRYCTELLERFLRVIDQYFTTAEKIDEFFESYNTIVVNTLGEMKQTSLGLRA